jgi:hypothetical protein
MDIAAKTTGLDWASFGVALAAFVVSCSLAGIRVWEAWGRRSKWRLHFDWIHSAQSLALSFTVANIGTRRYGIREIRFGTPETPKAEGWLPSGAVRDNLPLMLDEGEISNIFTIESTPSATHDFDRILSEGGLRKCMVEDARGRVGVHHIPAPELREPPNGGPVVADRESKEHA